MLQRITTANPNAAYGGNMNPNQLVQKNYFMEAAQQQRQAEQNSQDRQIQAFEKMSQNPQMASQIAETYQIPFTPELQKITQNQKMMQQVTTGMKLIKESGVKDPKQAGSLLQNFIKSGGDASVISSSTQDMNYHPVPQGTNISKGQQWDSATGKLVPIAGYNPIDGEKFAGKELDDPRVPLDLRIEAKAYLKDPYGMSVSKPKGYYQDLFNKIQSYTQSPQGVQQPEGQPDPNGWTSLLPQTQHNPKIPADAKYLGMDVDSKEMHYQLPNGGYIIEQKF